MEQTVPVSNTKIPLGIIVGFFVVVGVSAFAPASWFLAKKQPVQSKLDLSVIAEPGKFAEDTNKDGEISWKELAMSSLGINPAEAEGIHIEMSKDDLDTLNDPDNLTSSFSKNMYIASLAIQQQGGLDAERKQQIVDQLMKEETEKMATKKYMASDITTTPDTKESIKEYGNKVAAAVGGLITKDAIIDTMTSLDAYTNKGQEDDLVPLQKHAVATTEAMKKLLSIKVPASMTAEHLTLLNRYEAYKDLVHNLVAIKDDALRSTLALKEHQSVTLQALQEKSTLGLLIKNKGVTFSSLEPGYWFISGYTK